MARRDPEIAVIAAVTHDGRGITEVSGKKVFVAGALAGERVRFLRRKLHRKYDEAELLEVLDASPSRIEPRCAAFGRCGGCSMQHVSEENQREIKEQALRDSLERVGRVSPARWLPALYVGGEDGSWHYRRRARLAVKDVPGKGRVLVGFRERHAPYITDMHRCEVLARPVDSLIDPLSELVAGLSIRSRLPQIEVAVADNAVELVFRVLDPPTEDDRRSFAAFARSHGIRVSLQPGGLDSVEPLWPEAPREPLYYALDDHRVRVEFRPVDFVQINASINRSMVNAAIEYLEVEPGHRVLDLFCGIGNFTLPLARRAASVVGVEGEGQQVERARANAGINRIGNAEFIRADLFALSGDEPWLVAGCDRMLLDPARTGAFEVAQLIRVPAPSRIVYVSCHPGTLARDAGELVHNGGYRLLSAGIIDMFPHTNHVESIAVFEKKKKNK
ncbi:MAG: 23S rRNA (uracil(1939)-C(5))-methyltransferase RlmD [Gammaproteobacteria bacterium]|nr:23S rRNA (uracil(1939)-C(5))-methyltransferase RlmD [Gammaproteobacteria bacterium]MDH4252891.1 23S rRNA (uracil(1939)-C(5))-methyltransferase RlmD [Gammaproteobacteria bacterium]MDH5308423.1 23S rRNA (uracil(1939)-C(5))-methyltransferase RlmD [Gammaproteobacteria bacterium]